METVQQKKGTQPFFRPLSSPMSTRTQMNYAPVTTQRTETCIEIEQTAEHQSTLHSRLQQEAEKIRKWKVQTEIELKQKERKIQESNRTIDCLRKSMLEQQLQNESLSLKLQEEIASREEIMQKINATRDMCNLLKDFAAKVDGKLEQCERERDDLKYMELNHQKQYEDLAMNFKELQISAANTNSKLANQLQKEREEKNEMSCNFQQQLTEAHMKLQAFVEESDIKNNQIMTMTEQLQEKQSNLEQLQQTKSDVEKQLADTELITTEQNSRLDEILQELTIIKDEKARLESQLRDTSNALQEATQNNEKLAINFDETEKLYVQNIEQLQQDLQNAQQQLVKETAMCVELQSSLTKAHNNIEDLKCAKDMLTLERTEARNKCQDLDLQRASLMKKTEELEKKVSHLSAEKTTYMEEVECLKNTIVTLQKELDCIGEELKEANAKEKCSSRQLDVLQQQLDNQSDEQKTTSERIATIIGENKSLKKELNGSKKEVNTLKKDLERSVSKESTISTKLDKRHEETKMLKDEIHALQVEIRTKTDEAEAKLLDEKKQMQSLQDELRQWQKESNKSQKDLKRLETDATNKSKKIEELNEEVAKWKETADKESKAKDAVARDFSMQMNGLLASLDKFKLENQKAVLSKESELAELKEKLGDAAVTKEKEMESLREELEHVKSELSNVKKDKEDEVQKLMTEMEKLKCDETKPLNVEPSTPKSRNNVPPMPKPLKTVRSTPKFMATLPSTQKPLQSMPSTPKPLKTVSSTPEPPISVPSTPKPLDDVLCTPQISPNVAFLHLAMFQKSILKQTGSVPKRRRVVFAAVDNLDDAASSDSFSGLEVEADDIENHFKDATLKGTPLLLRTPPRRVSARSPRDDCRSPLVMKPVPRGPPIQSSCNKKIKLMMIL
ncbi:hypothetical protein NP493_152g03006 [Ridgeia piscesae]|uniref:Synaptonemal complex protein 1 n=1 Tax=Ridgeia piscesae TaxID=27915 RepID=A0AAD9P480_RIDPI|nr:hypothetical protein NP493_152g03006 [Ridgeia piscesae]